MYILGIDGGGTKTTGVVADEEGQVYMQAVAGPSNPNTMPWQEFENVMESLLRQIKEQDAIIYDQIAVCFAGMSGVGESGKDLKTSSLLQKHLHPETDIVVRNDAYNALYAGTLGNAGIVQIAGTGSITFGHNYEEKTVRSGGWGYLFDDAGSGFYFGNEALRAVFKTYDQRKPDTVLTELILSHFQVGQVPDLLPEIYGSEHPRSVIAPLAPLVLEAAKTDAAANGIFKKACEEMMDCISSCHGQLFEPDHPTVIVLSGGVFTNPKMFVRQLTKLSAESLPHLVFRETRTAPVGGAIVGGLKAKGITAGDNFVPRLNAELEKPVAAEKR